MLQCFPSGTKEEKHVFDVANFCQCAIYVFFSFSFFFFIYDSLDHCQRP